MLRIDGLSTFIDNLDRPEGIAVDRAGRVIFTDHHAAVTIREPDGTLSRRGDAIAPCGVALDGKGNAIVANMGLLSGKPGVLQRVALSNGADEKLAESFDGRALLASNSPCVAADGTIYCSHSSWGNAKAIGKTIADGFVYMVSPGGKARIVATGIRGANGTCIDPAQLYLYVAVTPEARIIRYRRLPDGRLGPRENFGPQLGEAVPDQTIDAIRALPPQDRRRLGYCDGIAFDADGNLWVTLPFANRLVAITPAGELIDVMHDGEGSIFDMPTNIAWGGKDRRDLFIVARARNMIVRGRTNVRGAV
ncbi:SMP-30/gluconolactonase/LRE family protein [Sphingomonas crocodyli]|uniref:SMP-30/gluconolactonase/LRE family protein n=1 Tax=Sphingomonas crocodyli TaxID=1979270 RepID=UPI0013E39A8B|nr:SMP-30/gluconolactonase/LRE family protein [Sphingomonas crocodyli]